MANEVIQITANLPKIIAILRESLYSDPTVAIRELIQNANDSCQSRLALDANLDSTTYTGRARISFNLSDHTLLISDNGKGLMKDEIKKLTEIGTSDKEEIRELLEAKGKHTIAQSLIGRFGLGLLSTLIIADSITFDSLSYVEGAEPIRWIYTGGEDSVLERGTCTSIGTTVILKIKIDHVHVLNERYLTQTIRLYGDLLPCEFYLNEIPQRINSMIAPWDKTSTKQEYRSFISERYIDPILDIIPIQVDERSPTGNLKLGGVLYIPKKPMLIVEEHGNLIVYANRMFVRKDEQQLLPDWAKFVDGIIESPNLNLPISRETLRQDEVFYRIRAILGEVISNHMVALAQQEKELFRRVVTSHNIIIKSWAIVSDELFSVVEDMVLFHTDDDDLTLPEYFLKVNRLKGGNAGSNGRRHIYYTSTLEGASHIITLFKMQGLVVIDASHFPDVSFLRKYAEWHPDVDLRVLEAHNDFLFEPIEVTDEWRRLENTYTRLFNIKARIVRFMPEFYPAVLILSEPEFTSNELKDILEDTNLNKSLTELLVGMIKEHEQLLDEQQVVQGTLYINADNYMISRLVTLDLGDSEMQEVLKAIYFNALLLSMQGAKKILTPEYARGIFETTNRTFTTLINNTLEVRRLRAKGAELAVSDAMEAQLARNHVLCFIAIPFRKEHDMLVEAIKDVFETSPYFWEVRRADDQYFNVTIPNNVGKWIEQADCYIAEITEMNDNVMMELGLMYWGYPKRPLLIMQQENSYQRLADLEGYLRILYPWADNVRQADIAKYLQGEVAKFSHLQQLSQLRKHHFLSPRILPWISPLVAQHIAEKYRTVEEFLSQENSQIVEKLKGALPEGIINDLKHQLKKICGIK